MNNRSDNIKYLFTYHVPLRGYGYTCEHNLEYQFSIQKQHEIEQLSQNLNNSNDNDTSLKTLKIIDNSNLIYKETRFSIVHKDEFDRKGISFSVYLQIESAIVNTMTISELFNIVDSYFNMVMHFNKSLKETKNANEIDRIKIEIEEIISEIEEIFLDKNSIRTQSQDENFLIEKLVKTETTNTVRKSFWKIFKLNPFNKKI